MELPAGEHVAGVRGRHSAFHEQFWPALPRADALCWAAGSRELLSTNRVLSGQEVDTKGEFRGAPVIALGLFVHCLYKRAMPLLGIAPGGQSCERGDPAAAHRAASCATFAVGRVIPVASLPLALRYTCAAIVPCGARCRPVTAVPVVAPRGLELVLSPGQGAGSVRVPKEVLIA
jgi:hypothetical protein